jgi:hypothetical protein
MAGHGLLPQGACDGALVAAAFPEDNSDGVAKPVKSETSPYARLLRAPPLQASCEPFAMRPESHFPSKVGNRSLRITSQRCGVALHLEWQLMPMARAKTLAPPFLSGALQFRPA